MAASGRWPPLGEVESSESFLKKLEDWAGSRAKRTKLLPQLPADAASISPSALYRRTDTVRSSVRSHGFDGSQPAIPRRRHCRPPALFRRRLERSARPVWPDALAGIGTPAHLAGLRSTRAPLPSHAARSEQYLGQSQRAAPTRSCFSERGWHTRPLACRDGAPGPQP